VPDSRRHRGADPRDAESFGPSSLPALRAAVRDLSWLLSRGYAPVSALKLVGDRWSLTERQRHAVRRSACSVEACFRRGAGERAAWELAGVELWIDGFNVMTTLETWLGGGVVLCCRDGTYRDIAGIHGTYRRVAETLPAIAIVAAGLARLGVRRALWLFDRPVSNSGRIGAMIRRAAEERSLDWTVDLVDNPDPILAQSNEIVATADSAILDAGPRWFNLVRHLIDSADGGAAVIDIAGD
jgi:hypothetical protein